MNKRDENDYDVLILQYNTVDNDEHNDGDVGGADNDDGVKDALKKLFQTKMLITYRNINNDYKKTLAMEAGPSADVKCQDRFEARLGVRLGARLVAWLGTRLGARLGVRHGAKLGAKFRTSWRARRGAS
ncbi:hypothetical protein PoB_002561900 [Plakobranchus ocellatus]|uniref:Uncharacterized protein n=1 Tax=Plakobranchus ocellatus TaxID=259542 RepID=A0AAV3ZYU2_9GAST|nr:hypothetical protein PoB_002561900 [Plakobranchus ocellatus]